MVLAITRSRIKLSWLVVLLAGCGLGLLANGPAADAAVALPGHLAPLVAGSQYLGRMSAAERIDLAIVLPLRNADALNGLLRRIYDPSDTLYGQYLSPSSFAEGYGPTQADYDAVKAFALSQGLTVTHEHSNRLILDVSGPAANVEPAFGVTLRQYQTPDGRVYRAADANPTAPDALAGKIAAIAGLSTSIVHTAKLKIHHDSSLAQSASRKPLSYSGHKGYSPADILAGYGLYSTVTGGSATGSGEVLAVLELGTGYSASNVSAYTSYYSSYFNLFEGTSSSYVPPVAPVSVDGQSTTYLDTQGEAEADLDIELTLALAPKATKVLVYEAPNTDAGWLDALSLIATDTTNSGTGSLPNTLSISWGSPEVEYAASDASVLVAENSLFTEMAAQGQSVFSASGDEGAYTDFSDNYPATPCVSDPAAQPYVCGVGGTTLSLNGSGSTATWASETTWNNGLASGELVSGASGGGISVYWPIPAYQTTYISSSNEGSSSVAKASSTMRNVPDVALNADPDSGYDILTTYKGDTTWFAIGGTSAASPLWAAFAALANQTRVANGLPVLGEINASVYPIASGSHYGTDFQDIVLGNNLLFNAASGYDCATGWGSFNGSALLADLAPSTSDRTFSSGLTFFSVPYDYSKDTLAALFGYASPYVVWWNPATSAWTTVTNVALGKGYWVRFPQAVTLSGTASPGVATTSVSGSTYFPISLSAGWNQIGNPFPYAITLSDTCKVGVSSTLYSWSQALARGYVLPTLYYYNPSVSTTAYQTITTGSSLAPKYGYWIYATVAETLYLR